MRPQTDCDWLMLHVESLFEIDGRGRLRPVDTGAGEATAVVPRFYLSRSGHGNLWRFRADLPDATIRTLSRLASREHSLPVSDGLPGPPPPPERSAHFVRALAEDAPVVSQRRRAVFRLAAGHWPDLPSRAEAGSGARPPSLDAPIAACLQAWERAAAEMGPLAQIALDWSEREAFVWLRELGLRCYADDLWLV